MLLRRRREASVRRGQALVETALVLPILLFLLVMAADFGRVFFGWVALNNAARVGADYAAQWSSAWEGMATEEQDKRDRYVALIEADIRKINCDLTGGTPPDPTFADGPDADPGIYGDGDYSIVDLECSFPLITPLAEGLFGGPITLQAHEEFPVHRRILQAVPAPPTLPDCEDDEAEVPELVGERMDAALDLWTAAGFDEANFSPALVTSGPTRNANKVVTTQDLDDFECAPLDSDITVTHT